MHLGNALLIKAGCDRNLFNDTKTTNFDANALSLHWVKLGRLPFVLLTESVTIFIKNILFFFYCYSALITRQNPIYFSSS
jgi:hypothetical protein